PEPRLSRPARQVRLAFGIVACLAAGVAVAIAVTGGAVVSAGAQAISARTPQNALTAMWIALAICALATWRPRIRFQSSATSVHAVLAAGWRIAAVFIVLAGP